VSFCVVVQWQAKLTFLDSAAQPIQPPFVDVRAVVDVPGVVAHDRVANDVAIDEPPVHGQVLGPVSPSEADFQMVLLANFDHLGDWVVHEQHGWPSFVGPGDCS
tara:strand:- start:119 stop:430 length:312 start_codon:yes stop_codon:yes gene_type:complete